MSNNQAVVSWMSPRSEWRSRRGATRTVPMKVLALGFSRTGTSSLKEALQILGLGEVYHMRAVFENPPDTEMWEEALEMKRRGELIGREFWDQVLGHCQAVTDIPCVIYAEDLLLAYPEAKVILTLRDPARWWTSYATANTGLQRNRLLAAALWLDSSTFSLQRIMSVAFTHVEQIIGRAPTAAGAQARFGAHYERVRRMAAGRVLEFDVKVAGWPELCAFLEVPVPDGVEYPHVNDAAAFQEMLTATALVVLGRLAQNTLPLVALAATSIVAVGLALYFVKG